MTRGPVLRCRSRSSPSGWSAPPRLPRSIGRPPWAGTLLVPSIVRCAAPGRSNLHAPLGTSSRRKGKADRELGGIRCGIPRRITPRSASVTRRRGGPSEAVSWDPCAPWRTPRPCCRRPTTRAGAGAGASTSGATSAPRAGCSRASSRRCATCPTHIGRPPYAETGHPIPWDEPRIKSPEIIARMRRAGSVAAEILRLAGEMVRPGITTDEIDQYVHQLHIERDAYPSPLNYNGFPKSVCTSANEVICHGIPDSRVLQDGDILNIDVTAYIGGVHGDTNATFFVGDVDPVSRELVRVTEECMWHGIEAVKPGRPISDIGRAIEDHAKAHRYGVIRAFIGHGIGEQFHGDIQVLHYYDSRASMIMRPGHDVHRRADDQPRHVAAQDVGRRLDRGDVRRQAHGPVRAHARRHRRRAATCSPAGPARRRRPPRGIGDRPLGRPPLDLRRARRRPRAPRRLRRVRRRRRPTRRRRRRPSPTSGPGRRRRARRSAPSTSRRRATTADALVGADVDPSIAASASCTRR